MADPMFNQSTGDPALYWLVDPSLPAGYGVALLPLTGGNPPASINLPQSWTQFAGLYVMVGKSPEKQNESKFISALRVLLNNIGPSLRFLWLADATLPPEQWAPAVIQIAQTPGAATGKVSAPAQLAFGSYRVGIATGTTIGLTANGFSLTGGAQFSFSLRTPSSVWSLAAQATAISFSAAQAGCLLFTLVLPQDNEHTGIDDYVRLDVNFRFSVREWDSPTPGLLRSLAYPPFAAVPSNGVSFNCCFDPALPLNPARSQLAYAANSPAHTSFFRSSLGYGVSLTSATQAGDLLPAGLAFHRRPASVHAPVSDDPLYLGLIGSFALNVGGEGGGAPAARLSCGIGGTEYFGLSAATGALVNFTPGQPGFAWRLGAPNPLPDGEPAPALNGFSTVPWAAVSPAISQTLSYFAQPIDGALYQIRPNSSPPNLIPYLIYLELPAGSLAGEPAPYPMAPYAGIVDNQLETYRLLEAQILSPVRRAAIVPAPPVPRLNGGGNVSAITPQGLLASFSPNLSLWSQLSLVPLPQNTPPALALNNLKGALRQAMQTNQLFMVAADGSLFSQSTDLNYWITDAVLNDLAALPANQRPPASVLNTLRTNGRTPQVGAAAFTAMLQSVLSGGDQQYIPLIVQYSGYFEIVIAEWRFRLSPLLWQAQPGVPTLMVLKFATSTLRSLTADPSSWTWQAVGALNGDVGSTRDLLLQIIDAATESVRASAGQPNPLDFFVHTICDDPSWTGVVFLNAQTPFGSMPEELRGLAAGMDLQQFRAHHVGLSVSPALVNTSTNTLSLGPSSFFGLIDYDSPEHIAHAEGSFDFKVLLLRILFSSSAVSGFNSRIELFINRLFGDPVTLLNSDHYNNLVLNGAYQQQNGQGHYVFSSSDVNQYASASAVMDSITIESAQFSTEAANPTGESMVHSRFQMWGKLRYVPLEGFDLFSFGYELDANANRIADGYLNFSGLSVDMNFDPSTAEDRTFIFNISNMAFDLAASVPRSTSLVARFPLTLTTLIRGEVGQTPRDIGYEAVETPLFQPALTEGWYALVFSVDLGTMGALAAGAGLVMRLLAAWAPSTDRPAVNVGLQLPGAQTVKNLPAIEGVLQIGFQSIAFDANGALALPPNPAYVLRFRHFFLRILGWKFPSAQADIYLFGDPESAPQRNSALGWYAAWLKE